MNAPLPAGRPRWTSVAGGAGLLLVGALSVMNHLGLTQLAETNPVALQDARLQALAARVAELGEAAAFRPSAVPLSRYEAERGSIERRLTAIEQAEPSPGEFPALAERLARLEERFARERKKSVSRPSRPAPEAKPAAPSFRVIGVERRADERFLSILPQGTDSFSQARLLRAGETEDGWRLEAVEEESAVFRRDGRKYRLNLMPGRRP